jgi:DNA-binding CsgD family transcriptional regulator
MNRDKYLVHLTGQLSNPTYPLQKLFTMVREGLMSTILAAERRFPVIEHGRHYQLTPEDIDRLALRYEETKNMRQVAREFRISVTTVRSHLRILGIEVRRSKPMSEKQKEKAREMWAAGMTSTQIGKKLGFSHHTILKVVRR